MGDTEVTLPSSIVERLIQIAERAGVKQGVDVIGPFDTVVVEEARRKLAKARESA